MQITDVTVYYLEMLAPIQRTVPAPRDGLSVLHIQKPTVLYYRALYDAVGQDFHWLSRRKLSDEALAAIIGDPRDELHVLHFDDKPAGFPTPVDQPGAGAEQHQLYRRLWRTRSVDRNL